MDKNKLDKLHEIDYVIQTCCGICDHFRRPQYNMGLNFGTCKIHSYKHLKHTGEERELSVFESGWCKSFKMNERVELLLLHWKEFVK